MPITERNIPRDKSGVYSVVCTTCTSEEAGSKQLVIAPAVRRLNYEAARSAAQKHLDTNGQDHNVDISGHKYGGTSSPRRTMGDM